MASQRAINPEAVTPYVVPQIRPQIGSGAVGVWRFTVLVPVTEIRSDGSIRYISTAADRDLLEDMLASHFGGVTVPSIVPILRGFGARDPSQPEHSREANEHTYYTVYATVHEASDRYFRALRTELQNALVEGVILVERQDVLIL